METVQVVVAHRARATVRVGDVFLKIDPDDAGIDVEVAAMAMAPVPTPQVLWRRSPVLALSRVRGTALGRLGEPSAASPEAWRAAGGAIRALHETPPPPWPGTTREQTAARLDAECAALVAEEILPAHLVATNRRLADRALAAWTPVFVHGDLQLDHVFIDRDRVSGIIDWSAAGPGAAAADLATLTIGHPERLHEVLAGYAGAIDPEEIRGWWSLRGLSNIRWLIAHGFDPFVPGAEVDVLRRGAGDAPAG